MRLRLIDCFAAYGGPPTPKAREVPRDELLKEMDCLGIDKALARTGLMTVGSDVIERNRMLLADCAGQDRLIPCPILIPAGGGDLPPESKQVADFIRRGARAVCIRPGKDYFNLTKTVSGPLFKAAAERQLPLVCQVEFVPLAEADALLQRHPELRVILLGLTYRDLRNLRPTLMAHPNLYVSLGCACAGHEFLESLFAAGVGRQVVFGTGFPDSEPMMAVTLLAYAGISDADKQAVGSGNIERLISEVIR